MKKLINEFVDLKRLVLTTWLLLWAVLIILDIYKIVFNKWFPIVVENEKFLNFCEFIENHKIIYYIITGIFYCISNYIIYLTCTCKKKLNKLKDYISFMLIITCIYVCKIYNNIAGNLLEILLIIGYILENLKFENFYLKKANIIVPIIVYIILNLWQLNMLFVRDLHTLPCVFGIILQLDYYVFILITWIGVYFMGLWSMGWFFGKDITTLKAEKEKELAKEKPNQEFIKKIDEKILELENGKDKN